MNSKKNRPINGWTNFHTILLWALVTVCLSCIFIDLYFYHRQVQINEQINSVKSQNKKIKTQLRKRAANAQNAEIKARVRSSSPTVSQNSQQVTALNRSKPIVTKFFSVYTSFKNGKEYRSRASRCINFASNSLLQDHTIFDDGKDVSGGDYVTNSNLHSSFVDIQLTNGVLNNSVLPILAKVVTTSWQDKADVATNTDYYQLTYDMNTNKITSLQKIYTQKIENK